VEIVRLYDLLLESWPSPIVALNRAVAVAQLDGPDVALILVEELEGEPRLADYHYLPAIKADLLRRLGREDEALAEGQRALGLVRNDAERAFLDAQLRGRGTRET
jgi:RNA polymerase sigma-70 factor (ECF subfamily)